MAHTVLIAAADQATGYSLRSQIEEVEGFTVVDVADSTSRLNDLVARHDPEIVLAHENIGPVPVLGTIRDILARRPGTAVVLLSEELSPEVFTGAMDAGARGVIGYPVSHEELQSRLPGIADWVRQMRSHLSAESFEPGFTSRGRLVAVAGSKGGVGTTTVAAHLAHHAVTNVAGRSVCLIDLDLDNGDIADFLGITHRLDLSDLAKVADDLTPQTLGSAIHRSPSGLSCILGPSRIEDVGEVGDREIALILGALRRQFDVVVADCGPAVTPVTAAAVETADEVILVTTPDLLALRGAHRTVERWARVGAREVANVKILINKVSRDSDIQPETAARLLPAAPIESTLPEAFKVLQRGLNHQNPGQIQSKIWWERIGKVAVDVGTATTSAAPPMQKREPWTPFSSRKKAVVAAEQGQASIEFAGLIGTVILLVVIMWQVALFGVSAAYTGHAADEAAREAGIGSGPGRVQDVALEAVPSWFKGGMTVSETSQHSVKVRSEMPMLLPSVHIGGMTWTSETPIVDEGN